MEGATFVHVVLLTDLDDARERFVARSGQAVEDLRSADGSLAGFDLLYAGVADVLAQRPDAIPIRPTLDDLIGSKNVLATFLSRNCGEAGSGCRRLRGNG